MPPASMAGAKQERASTMPAAPSAVPGSEHSRVVVHHLGVGLVEALGQVGLSHRQTHGVADTLAQGASGHLHARGQEVLGVARGGAVPLAERLDVVKLSAGEITARAGG